MNTRHASGRKAFYVSLALATALFIPTSSFAQDQDSPPTSTQPDNSAKNKSHRETADQQSETNADRMITKKVRRSIVSDHSLSTYGHNVKIITQNGEVTLKGPVHSEDEKASIASKAVGIVGSPDKVHNELTVKE